jgi:dihydrofolate synthase/folylpolyglutamate synthase
MNYVEARDYIKSLIRRGIKYELSKSKRLLEILGNPEKKLKWIHITGTNGKGSTAAHSEGLLRGGGLKTGLFTSPHLVSMRERFRVNGEDIPEEKFAALVNRLRPAIEQMENEPEGCPTFFEICTAGAALYFLEEKVDVAIAEVGLGGRLDATNLIMPEVCVITNIGMDHPKTLGPTLADICREKCGIIKENIPLVCGIVQPDLRKIVNEYCERLHAPLFWLDEICEVSDISVVEREGTTFHFETNREAFETEDGPLCERLATPLLGAHQALNAAAAICAVMLLPENIRPGADTIQDGLDYVRWACRFEIISDSPLTVFDGGHNVHGIETLVKTWKALYPQMKAHIVAGFSGDKSSAEILKMLAPFADSFIFTKSENYRAADPDMLLEMSKGLDLNVPCSVEKDPFSAYEQARKLARRGGSILVTGSIYLLGAVLEGMEDQ